MPYTTYIHNGPLVIGAGLAGLSVALNTVPHKTLVLSPVALGFSCSSAWAQGGIAAALSATDSPQLHAQDTIKAGAGLVDINAAMTLTEMGAQTVHKLKDLGAPFDQMADGGFVLNREAAHGLARVARVGGDLAGKAILEAVVKAALAAPHIEIWEQAQALGLIKTDDRVTGALIRLDGQIMAIFAPVVVLAAGGIGGLYAVTTNPAALKGEGMAMAALAGAQIADAEFVQFHPTALNIGLDPAPLATEALRGEGATLIDAHGHRFVFDDHEDGELAPRDIVARCVHRANISSGGAFLDATKAIGADFPAHFPTVFASCQAVGIDPRKDVMPVAPAAHYHMGGIATDSFGHTSLKGLYAVGECAASGVHGANRLASNSLLEAAAFGELTGRACIQGLSEVFKPDLAQASIPKVPQSLLPQALQTLREAMSQYCGVIRDESGLKKLLNLIDSLEAGYSQDQVQPLALVAARLVAQTAFNRRESRGSHFRTDYPDTSPQGQRSFTHLHKPQPAV
jgi:L-aspartate oxidase